MISPWLIVLIIGIIVVVVVYFIYKMNKPSQTSQPSQPPSSQPPAPLQSPPKLPSFKYYGVNLAGAEFSPDNIPGVAETDYFYPSKDNLRIILKCWYIG